MSQGNNWTNVNDEMPANHIEVLVVVEADFDIRGIEKAAYLPGIGWYPSTACASGDKFIPGVVTHWQRLPSLPPPVEPELTAEEINALFKQCYKLLTDATLNRVLARADGRLREQAVELQRFLHRALNG